MKCKFYSWQRRCRRCFLRLAVTFLVIIIPFNFLVLRSEVERLQGQVPWGENFREDQPTGVDSIKVQHETRRASADQQDQSEGYLETAKISLFKLLGLKTELSEEEVRDIESLWPGKENADDDRILTQLNWRPPAFTPKWVNPDKLKYIFDKDGMVTKHLHGRRKFQADNCPIDTCFITKFNENVNQSIKADAMILRSAPPKSVTKLPGQIWIWFSLESPFHMGVPANVRSLVNWTATYRRDSTLVTPYEKFVPHYTGAELPDFPPGRRNYAKGKTKQVAWFVTNCKDQNGRLAYAKQLSNYIDVDIYGACGTNKCARKNATVCFEMLNRDYKFYLSFENSACYDYITEKLYWNALNNDVVPVVMGARPKDYQLMAPPGSYISVDDFDSPRELADYLHKVDQDDSLYNKYFRWKGTGSFINTKFWCRLCSMLHAVDYIGHRHTYKDTMSWWTGGGKSTREGSACLRRADKANWVSWSSKMSLTTSNQTQV